MIEEFQSHHIRMMSSLQKNHNHMMNALWYGLGLFQIKNEADKLLRRTIETALASVQDQTEASTKGREETSFGNSRKAPTTASYASLRAREPNDASHDGHA